jgi:hypothetical protein
VRPGQISHDYGDLVLARKQFGGLFLVLARSSRKAVFGIEKRALRSLRRLPGKHRTGEIVVSFGAVDARAARLRPVVVTLPP